MDTKYKHISLTKDGIPIIKNTTTKVIDLIKEYIAWGWGPEEIHLQHSYLSLGQIHSAFAYYWDNIEDFQKFLDEGNRNVEDLKEKILKHQKPSKLHDKKAG